MVMCVNSLWRSLGTTGSDFIGLPDGVRHQVFAEYGLSYAVHDSYEVGHLIPLELGGSNVIRNLWPENYRGFLNAYDKDRLENYLHDAVCSGRMPLQAAQETIATDWVKAYCAARLGECPAGL